MAAKFTDCEVCKKPGKLCLGCKMVAYCGAEHQRANWGSHKAFCKSAQARQQELKAQAHRAKEEPERRWLRFTDKALHVDMKLSVPGHDMLNRGAMFAETTREESADALAQIDEHIKGFLQSPEAEKRDPEKAAAFAQHVIILWHFCDERVVEVDAPADPKQPFS